MKVLLATILMLSGSGLVSQFQFQPDSDAKNFLNSFRTHKT